MGGKRSGVTKTSTTGHTTTQINFADGDAANYKVGDIIKVKEFDENAANVDHISPITVVVTTPGSNSITLLIPYFQAFTDTVVIGAFTTFFHQSGAPTVSLTQYLGGQIREKAIGMRAVTGELASFATGQLPTFTFSFEGLNYDREVGTPLFTPVFDGSLPPVVLCAKIFQDTTELELNEFSMSISNTLGFKTSTASKNGKTASRITELVTTFSANPYMEDDDVDQFTKFDSNTAYSIFGSAHNEGSAANEHLEVVGYYLPNCRSTELSTGDADGILTDAISGSAYKDLGNDSVFIGMI